MASDERIEEVFVETSDDDFQYEEVEIESEGDDELDLLSEDLEAALRSLGRAKLPDATEGSRGAKAEDGPRPGETVTRHEVVDDFVRNFLLRMGMSATLDSFEAEWYKLKTEGRLADVGRVPDVYVQNQALDRRVHELMDELDQTRALAAKATATWDQLRKERDFHKMHHKRVVQEKNKLIGDIKRVKKHYTQYEPVIKELRSKYEVAIKEKMLVTLERDRLMARIDALEAELDERRPQDAMGGMASMDSEVASPKNAAGATAGATAKAGKTKSGLPPTDPPNPFANLKFPAYDTKHVRLSRSFKAHSMPISSLALHPTRPILVTCSDDRTWKMWHVSSGELIMAGEGHRDWVAGADFHPKGTHLASGSGDMTVKIWDFEKQRCVLTFTKHAQAVWDVAFHHSGDAVASASLDHSARLWDIVEGKCKQVFKGHVDSVNACCWQPYTCHLCTASSDKTVSIWDARTGLCAQTFYGHQNSCSHAAFSLNGASLVSCDADGVVKVWDARMVSEVTSYDAGPHPANGVAIDRSGEVVAVACDDGKMRMFDARSAVQLAECGGHDDAVQSVLFDFAGEMVITSGSDNTFRIWA